MVSSGEWRSSGPSALARCRSVRPKNAPVHYPTPTSFGPPLRFWEEGQGSRPGMTSRSIGRPDAGRARGGVETSPRPHGVGERTRPHRWPESPKRLHNFLLCRPFPAPVRQSQFFDMRERPQMLDRWESLRPLAPITIQPQLPHVS